jgi:hypothetical protein
MQRTADHSLRGKEAISSSAVPKLSTSAPPTVPALPPLSPPQTPMFPPQPTSPQAPTSPQLTFVPPIPEPSSPFPTYLPPRPAPTHRGDFISRLFTRAPAHPADVELGALAQPRNSQPSIPAQERERVSTAQGYFWLKVAVASLFMLAFWVLFMVWVGIVAREGERGNGE